MRRAATLLMLAGLTLGSGSVSAQYPWSTPTKTRTPAPTRVVTATPIPATATPAPTRPPVVSPTPTPAGADLTIALGNCLTEATSRRLGPAATVEVSVGGVWRRVRPGRAGGCWLTDDGYAIGIGSNPFTVRWTLGNAREEFDGQHQPLRVLTAERIGASEVLSIAQPQVATLATRRQ